MGIASNYSLLILDTLLLRPLDLVLLPAILYEKVELRDFSASVPENPSPYILAISGPLQ